LLSIVQTIGGCRALGPWLGQGTKLVVNRFQLFFGDRLVSQLEENQTTRTKTSLSHQRSASGESIICILCQRGFSGVKLIYQSCGVKMRVDLNGVRTTNPGSWRQGTAPTFLLAFVEAL